jgi:hypothetical protein
MNIIEMSFQNLKFEQLLPRTWYPVYSSFSDLKYYIQNTLSIV